MINKNITIKLFLIGVLCVIQYSNAALYADPHALRQDKMHVLCAVQKNGLDIQHANIRLRQDPNVVLAAVQQNGLAL